MFRKMLNNKNLQCALFLIQKMQTIANVRCTEKVKMRLAQIKKTDILYSKADIWSKKKKVILSNFSYVQHCLRPPGN